MNFSQRLTETMASYGISAYRLSKDTGLSDSLIGYYRAGTRDITSKNLIKLADYLDVSVDYLLGRTDKQEINK